MRKPDVGRVVILGGGTAGWAAAAAMARVFQRRVDVTLVESPDIPIVGVGEATIPPILDFLRFLGIDEQDFVSATSGTHKLGIVFQDWREPGHRYWHPFGTFGGQINGRPFHHYWHRAKQAGRDCKVDEYSLAAALGEAHRIIRPNEDRDPLRAGFRYALHFDASLVGQYLNRVAKRLGVTHLATNVASVGPIVDGHVQHLVLADGSELAADLFIDCSGFRSVLLGQALGVAFHDWRHWLPCDRALAAPTSMSSPMPPYTLSAAHSAGWRWRIPLQHRYGNGVVYSSRWMSNDDAHDVLLASVGTDLLAEPRRLQFTTGRRDVFWSGNVVAIGLAAGFLEPLESTSIQLAINGITKLIDHFPDGLFGPHNIAAYNRVMTDEFDAVRDFIILHYCLTKRRDSAFWRHCAEMELPHALTERLALYRESGRIVPRPFEIFTDLSWFYVLEGMGVNPLAYDPIAGLPTDNDLFGVLDQIRFGVARIVGGATDYHRASLSGRDTGSAAGLRIRSASPAL